jgi:hypothetical protein
MGRRLAKYGWVCVSGAGYGAHYRACGAKGRRYFTSKECAQVDLKVHLEQHPGHTVRIRTIWLFGNGSVTGK